MKDFFVLNKCIQAGKDSSLIPKHWEVIASLYERFYPYGDFTALMDDMTDKFSNFPSSPLIEIFKQNKLMGYFIEEYFLNGEIYTPVDIEENKCRLMVFLIKINNLFKRLYLVNNQGEFVELFTKIQNVITQFSNETISSEKILNSNMLLDDYTYIVPVWSFSERYVFQSLAKAIVDYSFNASLRTKYAILSVIHKNILKSVWGYLDESWIRREIEEIMLKTT